MKPIYLQFCGVNSFSEPAEIYFDQLLSYGIFGIFGDTGSGKSTILDCIGFALYGKIARARSGSITDVINYKADRAYVNFEFAITYEGERRVFRVERDVKRKNALSTARVYERKGDKLLVLTDSVRESNTLLANIIGLEQRDFEKCIALPQGEFAQFVKSDSSDRLKLISRLFDLEQYGEQMIRKINSRTARLQAERDVLLARAEQFSDVSEEGVSALEATLSQKSEEEAINKQLLVRTREQEKACALRVEKQSEAKTVAARLALLEQEGTQIREMQSELARLQAASEFLAARRELMQAKSTFDGAKTAEENARSVHEGALSAEKLAAEHLRAVNFEDEIAKLTELKGNAERAEELKKRLSAATQNLERARNAYKTELASFPAFDYEGEKQVLTERLASLKKEDFATYFERNKNGLFAEEYAVFADELCGIKEGYPQTAATTAPLIEKYTLLSQKKCDFEAIKARFAEQDALRQKTDGELLELEKKNGAYRAHLERLSRFQTDGVNAKREAEELSAQLSALSVQPLREVEQQLNTLRVTKKTLVDECDKRTAQRTLAGEKYAAAQAALAAARATLSQWESAASEKYKAGDFADEGEAETLVSRYGDVQSAKQKVEQFTAEYASLTHRKTQLESFLTGEDAEQELQTLRGTLAALEMRTEELTRVVALTKEELTRKREQLGRKKLLDCELNKTQAQTAVFERLKTLMAGNKFIEFVAEEYLQGVASGASARLISLTDGRYFLRYQSGGFFVGDNFNGGNLRGVYTLSGGETFLVSLSLALSLSAEICAKSLRPIEFFFLDEGFGTLDERLVDIVMDSLEKLKNENFSIGIISHVEELKHRIGRKLTVVKASETHGSQILAE